jgi:hypothetical protein
MQVVNGYICRDCTDVARAKQGIDPAHPTPNARSSYARQNPDQPEAKPATTGDVGTRLHVVA